MFEAQVDKAGIAGDLRFVLDNNVIVIVVRASNHFFVLFLRMPLRNLSVPSLAARLSKVLRPRLEIVRCPAGFVAGLVIRHTRPS